MYLKNIRLVNFKNFDAFEADFSPKINTLTGPNGTGKTNILDAVYYLCFTKSYFSAAEGQNIRHGEDFMMLEGSFCRGADTDPVLMSLQRGAKKSVKRCGKLIDRMSEYAGLYPLVIVSPSDSDLIAEGSSQRRKFIDGVIAQTVPGYLNLLTAHARAYPRWSWTCTTCRWSNWDKRSTRPANPSSKPSCRYSGRCTPKYREGANRPRSPTAACSTIRTRPRSSLRLARGTSLWDFPPPECTRTTCA